MNEAEEITSLLRALSEFVNKKTQVPMNLKDCNERDQLVYYGQALASWGKRA